MFTTVWRIGQQGDISEALDLSQGAAFLFSKYRSRVVAGP
jgi:hypothetical protein